MPNLNASPNLVRSLAVYVHDLRETLKTEIKNRPIKHDDFPAIAIGCEYGIYTAFGHSRRCHKSLREEVYYVPPLLKALKKFAVPPTKRSIDGHIYFVGTCAEDSAANKVLQEVFEVRHSYPMFQQLSFTNPVRPRTYQRRPMCRVCKSIF